MKCSICKEPITPDQFGWGKGHNAAPINDGRCCSTCNDNLVIPVRFWEMKTGYKYKEIR